LNDANETNIYIKRLFIIVTPILKGPAWQQCNQ